MKQVIARFTTIRGQILVAFVAMAVVTGALGIYAGQGIRLAGSLVEQMFDKSLMSINYARAAAADFALMHAALTRWMLTSETQTREDLDRSITDLGKLLDEDLAIAAERSQSQRASRAARKAEAAVGAWHVAHHQLFVEPNNKELWATLDQSVESANHAIELLINYTAGDGFLYRQRAKNAVSFNHELTLIATLSAIIVLAVVAWFLAARITRTVAAASAAAGRIAGGDLSGPIPQGGEDELGALLKAMGIMRDNLRSMMDREVKQRLSAEARLVDALQSSGDGFVLLDSGGTVVLANDCAVMFLGEIELGKQAPRLVGLLNTLEDSREVKVFSRWLQISMSPTRDGGAVLVCTDITVLKENEVRLQSSLAWLDAAVSNIAQGLCLYDAESRLKVVNARFCEIFRLPMDTVRPGLHLNDILAMGVEASSQDWRTVGDMISEDIFSNRSAAPEGVQLAHLSDGRVVSIFRQGLADGGWVATYEDVTERRTAEAKIVYMARHDALTALPNRELLLERLELAVAQAGREGRFCALLFLDLDRFKAVNDTLGHPVGDALLRLVADRLHACAREVDTVARLGGDEFAIVQTGITRPQDAAVLARRIVEVLGKPFEIERHQVNIGTSIGISIAPTDGTSTGKLLKNADMALYKAKADGRATWRFFEPEMDASLQKKRGLEADLREAMAQETLQLHYQPIFDLQLGQVICLEALLRWPHPQKGYIAPSEFIPLAEELGLIIPLGEWALRRACADASSWPQSVRVAVNVSPAQFASGRLQQSVATALREAALSQARLELEITESVLLSDAAATRTILNELRNSGVKISMDDFGTGYSSLSYLRSFPFDKIKIDKSFINDLTVTSDADAIVRTMIGLGRSLRMRVTAEGVETAEQLAWLRAEGCTEVQGYFFSKAVPWNEVPRLLDLRFPEAVAA